VKTFRKNAEKYIAKISKISNLQKEAEILPKTDRKILYWVD
jgi:hypothetical protein